MIMIIIIIIIIIVIITRKRIIILMIFINHQINGENYLVPAEMKRVSSRADLRHNCLNINWLVAQLSKNCVSIFPWGDQETTMAMTMPVK